MEQKVPVHFLELGPVLVEQRVKGNGSGVVQLRSWRDHPGTQCVETYRSAW